MTFEMDPPDDNGQTAPLTDRLRAVLGDAGVDADADEIVSRLRGVAATPRNFDPDAQRALIVRGGNDALNDFLDHQTAELSKTFERMIRPGEKPIAETRLAALRQELDTRELTGFLVPRFDEHLGEYVARHSQRLAWLTGFTGSAGTAVVLKHKAALFVDGRYTVQAPAETSADLYQHLNSGDMSPSNWLKQVLEPGDRVGYDPWLHTPDAVKSLREACAKAGAELIAVDTNPVDAVWTDQPPPPLGPIIVHPESISGESSASKRAALADVLSSQGADAAVLTAPDSIAWLLNIRGGDLPHTPVALGFAILHADATVDLFIDPRKFTDGVTAHLGDQVRVHGPENLAAALDGLGRTGKTVRLDPAGSVVWLFDRLDAAGATLAKAADPCAGPKASKNQTELAGIRACHIRDGAGLTRYIRWVTETAPKGGVTELDAAREAGRLRAEVPDYRDLSFGTISASGPNAALPHYSATEHSNRELGSGELYLVDSGCQYPDGTTDVTRTVAIGTPTDEHRDRFTRVLKGHIALTTCKFPAGTSGSQLDAFARRPLWEAGLDYEHGTGHGVGTYLSVHEGPHRISKLPAKIPLEPGMIVSNEPGYYKVGDYGIRIENLIEVVKVSEKTLGFHYLTCAPIDLNLVERSLLSDNDATWLNTYHAWVRENLTPILDAETAAWLEQATRQI